MQFTYQKLFMNHEDEIKWLDKMAQRGLLLVKRAPFFYYFDYNSNDDKNYKYKIVYMHDAIANGASDEEMKSLPNDGSRLACSYKNRAYLIIDSEQDFGYYDDSHARYKHFLAIWSFYLVLFIASLSALAYHVGYAVEMILREKPIPSTFVISVSGFVLLCVAALFAYYLDKALLWKKKYKFSQLEGMI